MSTNNQPALIATFAIVSTTCGIRVLNTIVDIVMSDATLKECINTRLNVCDPTNRYAYVIALREVAADILRANAHRWEDLLSGGTEAVDNIALQEFNRWLHTNGLNVEA